MPRRSTSPPTPTTSAGRLPSAKDPRTNLTTTYTYDTAGRLAQITPPGQATWTLAYDGGGRISTVSRPTPGGSTATQTVVYDVPASGASAPIDLSAGTVAGWAQQDLPLYGAGVFTADHVPSSPSPPSSSDWPYADLTYLNTDGRQVNSASYGNGAWQITTTEHDAKGNTVRTLSAENRNQALTPTADTDPTVASLTTSAARSQQLDEQTVYTADGVSVARHLRPDASDRRQRRCPLLGPRACPHRLRPGRPIGADPLPAGDDGHHDDPPGRRQRRRPA
ncbi:RHS repeat domain-containing protein [Candidatus Frankia alpina]|uniref:RHS repeat domain-containing protein n=1 Tax=Candidatus Frankia alpina TaxID=2699483 RepID=UPI001F326BF8|nr:RHS repeat domain-containing protein [Candidatus Frankia alpina]